MGNRRKVRTALATATLLAFGAVAGSAGEQEFKQELRRYKKSPRRPSLYIRALAMERLAATSDPGALKLLIKRYRKPEAPDDHVGYLAAGIAHKAFPLAEHSEAWQGWISKTKKPRDGWVHYLGSRLRTQWGEGAALEERITDPKADAFLRAAALQGLASVAEGHERALALVPALIKGLGAKRLSDVERAVLVEACAASLYKAAGRLGEEAFTKAALAVIEQLDDEATLRRTRWVIARQLGHALKSGEVYLTAEPWKNLLLNRAARAQQDEGAEPKRTRLRAVGLKPGVTIPRFLGIEGTGTRVVFVIDCSDSMLKPLSEAEKEAIKQGPKRVVTGSARKGKPGEAKPEEAAEPKDPLANLPWDRIKTRFDAAREALILSLGELGEKMHYAVITFGTDSTLLSQSSLLPATKANVKRSQRALRRIRTKMGDAKRPHGRLMGYTNLHGALLDAFQVTNEASLLRDEHVAPRALREGADVIFVLSDGAPSWDDFPAVDKNDLDMNAGDPEGGGAKGKKLKVLNFYGPYVFPRFLLRDVVRLNLYRKAEIHCVGIGEASATFLENLATLGQGEFRSVQAPR